MPLVMMHTRAHTTISGSSAVPNSHLCLSLIVLFGFNPPFGLIALIFTISSKFTASRDYESARIKGQISMFISVAGIIISIIGAIVFIMVFYTKDA